MSTACKPLVILLRPDGLRDEPARLYVEDGLVFIAGEPAYLLSDVTDTGERSMPEGWPILRFQPAPDNDWSPVAADMIVKGGLEALGIAAPAGH